ncbi:cation-transporting P-type ATPase, partial [Puniceibacterium confluentis]
MNHGKDFQPQLPPLPAAPHARSVRDTIHSLGTSLTSGLASSEVLNRRARLGANILAQRKPISLARLIRHQFESA